MSPRVIGLLFLMRSPYPDCNRRRV